MVNRHPDPAAVAELFHGTYERLAPQFGYETRRESAVPWPEVPENSRALMTAVCAEVLEVLQVTEWVDAPGDFQARLARLLNQHCAENASNTPDFILADFLLECLQAYNAAVLQRAAWYGRIDEPGRGGQVPFPAEDVDRTIAIRDRVAL